MSRRETAARVAKEHKPKAITFAFAYRSLIKDVGLGVHAPGCKDLASERRKYGASVQEFSLEVSTMSGLLAAALKDYNTDFSDLPAEEQYGKDIVKIYDCAKALLGEASDGQGPAKCLKCKQSAASDKDIIHRISCTDYSRGKVMPIARIVPDGRSPKESKAAEATPPRPSLSQGGTVDLATECKRLRDEGGMAWWLIGKTLGLPGAGDSATTGKSGAHQARRLYATKNGGEVPRTRAPRNGGVKAEKGPAERGSKTDRKVALTIGEHVIPEDLDEDSVVAMLAGRVIEWGVNLADLCPGPDEWFNHEARVHPTDVIVDEDPSKDGSRTIRFREFHGYIGEGRDRRVLCGPTRTVRLRSIHTVRG